MGEVAGEMEGDSILERRASMLSPQSFLLEALETSFSTCMAAVKGGGGGGGGSGDTLLGNPGISDDFPGTLFKDTLYDL